MIIYVNGCMVDSSEADTLLADGDKETELVELQSASVQLDKDQIALYKGNREYQTITVEQYSIGIFQLVVHTYHLTAVFQIYLD